MSRPADEQDYYGILGVNDRATPEEITAAYYLLARAYHPDTGVGDPESLHKFKSLNEAYQVLSDEQQRREYDARLAARRRSRTSSPGAPRFAAAGADRFKPTLGPLPQPGDTVVDLNVTPEEARFGGWCEFKLTRSHPCRQCGGSGRIEDMPCPECQGRGTTRTQELLEVAIPPGARTGMLCHVGRAAATSEGSVYVRLMIRPCW